MVKLTTQYFHAFDDTATTQIERFSLLPKRPIRTSEPRSRISHLFTQGSFRDSEVLEGLWEEEEEEEDIDEVKDIEENVLAWLENKSHVSAFLKKIAADPDVDLHRLILADWLEEQGNKYATLIRMQCTLENPNASEEERRQAENWLKENAKFITACAKAWKEALKLSETVKISLERGMPVHMSCSASELLASLNDFLTIQSVELTECTSAQLQTLGQNTWFQKVALLTLIGCGLQNVDGLRGCTGLTSVNMWECSGLQNVDGLRGCTGLTQLDLWRCTGLENLDGLRRCTGLKWLDLRGCTGLENLDGLRRCTGLKWLNLRGCTRITEETIVNLQQQLPNCSIMTE